MADGDLEEFTIDGSAPIESSDEMEGTNASRFAIAGALTAPAPTALLEALGPVANPDVLERFGFGQLLESVNQGLQSSDESLTGEAVHLLDQRRAWDEGVARETAWDDLTVRGEPRARLMLLAAGACSPLERESVAGAVALLGVVREPPGWSERLYAPWDLRFFSRWREWDPLLPWADPIGTMGEGFPEEVDVERLPSTTVPWDGPRWRDGSTTLLGAALAEDTPGSLLTELNWLALRRISLGLRSQDVVTRELAHSASLRTVARTSSPPGGSPDTGRDGTGLGVPGPGGPGGPGRGTGPPPRPPGAAAALATMIHGTNAWKGDWWHPPGDFHDFIKNPHRPQLYDGGMEYAWSGAYSRQHREIAGDRFLRWTRGASPNGLGSVFAHSYGGEVAARAINLGADVSELVLLSAPVNEQHVAAITRVDRVVDIRLDFDLVLWLAAAHQRMPADHRVLSHVVPRAYWRHGATHDPHVWKNEHIATQVAL